MWAAVFVLNATWELPSPKSWSGPAKWISDGWQLGTILTLSDGVPFTPTWGTGGDPATRSAAMISLFQIAWPAPGAAA